MAIGDRIAEQLGRDDLSAAYVGASNGDDPAFAEIFEAAFSNPRFATTRHVTARYSAMDHMCLSQADVIVLGGGDVLRGWTAMRARGMADTITQRWLQGSVMVGVSAGAIQLARGALGDDGQIVATFGFVPVYVAVHDEARDFASLAELLRAAPSSPAPLGIGIPHGAAALYCHEDGLVPIRHALVELRIDGDETNRALLSPDGSGPS